MKTGLTSPYPSRSRIERPSFPSPLPISPLRLLLASGLGGLFPVTPDHNHADKGADDGGGEEDKEDRNADGPDARGEEGVEDVVVVDEGLREFFC